MYANVLPAIVHLKTNKYVYVNIPVLDMNADPYTRAPAGRIGLFVFTCACSSHFHDYVLLPREVIDS